MTYDVYAMGNALLDYEFEVSDKLLQELEISKGVMTLIDPTKEEEVLNQLKEHHQRDPQCGGSAANTIIALSQMGGRSYYSCKVANDMAGKFYRDNLEEHSIDSNLQKELSTGVTGKCLVMVTPDAQRTMLTHLGISQSYSKVELDSNALARASYLYIEGYLLTSEQGKEAALEAIKIAKENKVKLAITFSDPFVVQNFRQNFEEVFQAGSFDLVFANEDEAKSYTGQQAETETFEAMKKVSRQFCITQSERGAVVFDGKEKFQISCPQVKAVDTVGAGDMFAGAFFYGLSQNWSFPQAGELACRAASRIVESFGPRLSKDESLKLLED